MFYHDGLSVGGFQIMASSKWKNIPQRAIVSIFIHILKQQYNPNIDDLDLQSPTMWAI